MAPLGQFTFRKGPSTEYNFVSTKLYVSSTTTLVVDYPRSTIGPFPPIVTRPHFNLIFPMANSQHDPVVAQLERQKLTASPSHLAVFYFHSAFLLSSLSRA